MKLIISKEVATTFPSLRVGVLRAEGVSNSAADTGLESLKASKVEQFREVYSLESLRNHPNILAWRETYRSFGAKPKRYRPTAEALLTRILKGDSLPSINSVVDGYLLAELDYLLPIGGYDLDEISGDITLRISPGGEVFHPLGSDETETTKEGEVIYADDDRVLTRRWNYRDCEATKITVATKNVALFVEAAQPSVSTADIEGSLAAMEGYIGQSCGGVFHIQTVSAAEGLEWSI